MLLLSVMQSMFPQGLQHCPEMNSMLMSVLGVYQDIFYKHHHKLVQIRSKNSIHKIHEGSEGIGQAKRHRGEFIVTKFGPECGFENVFEYNPKLMVCESQINLRKYSCSLQSMK